MAVAERFGPTRRGGPVFRWLGEPLAIDLANTVMVVRPEAGGTGEDEVDLLSSAADLRRWLAAESERLAAFAVDAEEDLGAIRELRTAVRALLAAAAAEKWPPKWAVDRVN